MTGNLADEGRPHQGLWHTRVQLLVLGERGQGPRLGHGAGTVRPARMTRLRAITVRLHVLHITIRIEKGRVRHAAHKPFHLGLGRVEHAPVDSFLPRNAVDDLLLGSGVEARDLVAADESFENGLDDPGDIVRVTRLLESLAGEPEEDLGVAPVLLLEVLLEQLHPVAVVEQVGDVLRPLEVRWGAVLGERRGAGGAALGFEPQRRVQVLAVQLQQRGALRPARRSVQVRLAGSRGRGVSRVAALLRRDALAALVRRLAARALGRHVTPVRAAALSGHAAIRLQLVLLPRHGGPLGRLGEIVPPAVIEKLVHFASHRDAASSLLPLVARTCKLSPSSFTVPLPPHLKIDIYSFLF